MRSGGGMWWWNFGRQVGKWALTKSNPVSSYMIPVQYYRYPCIRRVVDS